MTKEHINKLSLIASNCGLPECHRNWMNEIIEREKRYMWKSLTGDYGDGLPELFQLTETLFASEAVDVLTDENIVCTAIYMARKGKPDDYFYEYSYWSFGEEEPLYDDLPTGWGGEVRQNNIIAWRYIDIER